MYQHSTLSQTTIEIGSSLTRTTVQNGLRTLNRLVPLPDSFAGFLSWALVLAIVAGGILLQVWTSLLITEARMELASLQTQHAELERENAQILWQISQYASLEKVEQRARELGYVPATQRRYVSSGQPVAAGANPAPVAATAATVAAPESENPLQQVEQKDAGVFSTAQASLQSGWQTASERSAQLWHKLQTTVQMKQLRTIVEPWFRGS